MTRQTKVILLCVAALLILSNASRSHDISVKGDDDSSKKKKKPSGDATTSPATAAASAAVTPAAAATSASSDASVTITLKPWSKVTTTRDIVVPDHPGWVIPTGTPGTVTQVGPHPYVQFNIKGPWGDGTSQILDAGDIQPA